MLVSAARVLTPAAVFLRVEGKDNAGITIGGGAIEKAAKPLELAAGAGERVVKVRI